MPATDGCPWEQCSHRYNAHAKDHCLACECEKPPPPLPAPTGTEEVELETIEADVCNVCSAYVADREKHVTWHERMLDTITNLVMSLGALERRSYTEEATRRAEQAKDT